jgi:coenzyme Q-binding protein COQ10
MPQFSVTRRLPFRPADLYAIAADVPSYPRFVPLCADARVWDESKDADDRRHFRAAIDLAYPKLRLSETLTSEVTTDPGGARGAGGVDGGAGEVPRQPLAVPRSGGGWHRRRFLHLLRARSWTLQLLVGGMFDYAVRKIINAFEARARELYEPVG